MLLFVFQKESCTNELVSQIHVCLNSSATRYSQMGSICVVFTKGKCTIMFIPGINRRRKYIYVSLRLRVQNGISRLISALCVNCLISIPEYSRIRLRVQNGISRLISALCVNCLISILEYSRLNHLDVHLV